jgi:MFS family permease
MKSLFKWVYLIGLLVAIVAALVNFSAQWLTSLLILAGVLVGIFYCDSEDLVNQGIRYLVLGVAYMSLSEFIGIGSYLTSIFGAVFAFLGPVLLAVLVMHFVKKYFMSKA